MFDTPTLMRLNDLRGRVLRQEHVSDEELCVALAMIAQGRAIASATSVEKKAKAKPIVVASGQSLLEMMAANIAKKKAGADPVP